MIFEKIVWEMEIRRNDFRKMGNRKIEFREDVFRLTNNSVNEI